MLTVRLVVSFRSFVSHNVRSDCGKVSRVPFKIDGFDSEGLPIS